jgi:ribosomal protein S18 acetylase RimI-like enzyme
LALTGSGEKAKFLIVTLTFGVAPAAAEAQAAALLAAADGAAADGGAADAGPVVGAAADAGADAVAGAVVTTGLGVEPVPQAPRTSAMASASAERSSRCIEVVLPSFPRTRGWPRRMPNHTLASGRRFSPPGIVPAVTLSFPKGRPADFDAAGARWLARHEARCHALSGREVRELGDGVLLHDPADREPFWNRLAGVAWPSAAGAFDHRLAEVLALFASLDRIPHIWPQPGFDEPADLTERLLAFGFDDLGAGLLMGLDPDVAALEAIADPDVTIARLDGDTPQPDDAPETIRGIAAVLAEAFTIEWVQAEAIETDTRAAMTNASFHAILVRVDGEPASTVRRTTFDGASYLSSIGTRPAFRGRGLGRLVTALAATDSLAAGSRLTYLGVFAENTIARRLYHHLGFVPIGRPGSDLLLSR